MRTRLLRAATAGRSILELTRTKSRKQTLIKGELIKGRDTSKRTPKDSYFTPPLQVRKITHIYLSLAHMPTKSLAIILCKLGLLTQDGTN